MGRGFLLSALILAGITAGCAKRSSPSTPASAKGPAPATTITPYELTAQEREQVLQHRREEVRKRQEEQRLRRRTNPPSSAPPA
jgi:hypothetical protein